MEGKQMEKAKLGNQRPGEGESQGEEKTNGTKVELDQELCMSVINRLGAGREATYVTMAGTGGREKIKMVDVGVDGLPLADAAGRWGARVVGVVTPNKKERVFAQTWFPGAVAGSGCEVGPRLHHIDIDVVVGTASTSDKLLKFWAESHRLLPKYVMVLVPRDSFSRHILEERKGKFRVIRRDTIVHSQVGGVTTSEWKVLVAARLDVDTNNARGLKFTDTVPYQRSLRSVLKPTNGVVLKGKRLQKVKRVEGQVQNDGRRGETMEGRDRTVGYVDQEPVYDDEGLIQLSVGNWVNTKCVYHPGQKVIRQMTVQECLAAWDYSDDVVREGQIDKSRKRTLERWIRAPPGKVVRFAIRTLGEWLLGKPMNKGRSGENGDEGSRDQGGGDTKEEETVANSAGMDPDYSVATKADNAKVDVSLWDREVGIILGLGKITTALTKACALLRKRMFSWWRKNLTLECVQYLRKEGWKKRDVEAARECVSRAGRSTFMEWADGSRLFFWRWPREFRDDARDGMKLWYNSPTQRWFGTSTPADSLEAELKMRDKEEKLISRRYLEQGKGVYVESVVPRFAVSKGSDDIRVVWDARKNGVNEHLWAPHFFLPGSQNLEHLLTNQSYQGDMDVGEMFLNFMLHFRDRKHFGVRYFTVDEQGREKQELTRFCRLMFGSKSSPYAAVQMMYRAMEVMMGDPTDQTNIFGWKEVVLNLPGDPQYKPWKPKIAKLTSTGEIAPDAIFYVDDGRAVGASWDSCNRALHRMSSTLNMLGIQDAARKRRPPSKTPGAWAGVVTDTSGKTPTAALSEEKWGRLKEDIKWLEEQVTHTKGLEMKKALSVRGFLVHAARVYPDLKPYLKGLHLTLESWRPDRDEHGWTRNDWIDYFEAGDLEDSELIAERTKKQAPAYVQPVPLLQWSVQVLKALTQQSSPVQRPIRARQGTSVMYGFGDASGEGYGSSFTRKDHKLSVRHGVWCTRISEESSNYREFRNLLDSIKVEARQNKLHGYEVWMFTDNWVAESCYVKGSCHSRILNEMVAELHVLAMNHGFSLHIVHVAGTRMIAQGTDPLSRGEFESGVMGGDSMLAHIPLNLGAMDRSPVLGEWIRTWADTCPAHPESPHDWFSNGHKPGVHLWAPPPVIGLEVLEQVSMARHKRPYDTTHIIAIPRLMYYRWRKRLLKEADLILELPAGFQFWPTNNHEPLILAVCCPVCSSAPFRLREKREMVELHKSLQQLRKESELELRRGLREFWEVTRRLVTM